MSEVKGISNINPNSEYHVKANKSMATGSTSFSSYMEKTKDLDDIFERAAKKYNVSVDLLKAIGKAESGFDPNAVSRSGAQGVMQLMPATAKYLGVTDSFDPEQNIMGGSKYIAELLQKYDGDTKLALAAYNAGMGNVKKYGGIPPFKETQNYVVKVTKFMNEDMKAGTVSVTTNNNLSTKSVDAINEPLSWYIKPSSSNQKINQEDVSGSLESIFSYSDYLRFLDLLNSYNYGF